MVGVSRRTIFALFFFLTTAVNVASAQVAWVQGTVVDGVGVPIPGLTVFLVHPLVGRSYPAITGFYGEFVISNVPVMPDPYYLEIYWGYELIYRDAVVVTEPVTLPRIIL